MYLEVKQVLQQHLTSKPVEPQAPSPVQENKYKIAQTVFGEYLDYLNNHSTKEYRDGFGNWVKKKIM